MQLSTSARWPWPGHRLVQAPEPGETAASLGLLLEQTVARVFDVELDLMRLPNRGRARVAIARQVAMYLAHVTFGLSLTEAGDLFGRDRTTASHACQVVEERREDPEFDRALDLLENVARVLIGNPRR